MANRVRLTGLWKSKTKHGDTYLSAKVGRVYYQVMLNGFKKKKSDPDYWLYLSEEVEYKDEEDEIQE